jgi:hypothetical protein
MFFALGIIFIVATVVLIYYLKYLQVKKFTKYIIKDNGIQILFLGNQINFIKFSEILEVLKSNETQSDKASQSYSSHRPLWIPRLRIVVDKKPPILSFLLNLNYTLVTIYPDEVDDFYFRISREIKINTEKSS